MYEADTRSLLIRLPADAPAASSGFIDEAPRFTWDSFLSKSLCIFDNLAVMWHSKSCAAELCMLACLLCLPYFYVHMYVLAASIWVGRYVFMYNAHCRKRTPCPYTLVISERDIISISLSLSIHICRERKREREREPERERERENKKISWCVCQLSLIVVHVILGIRLWVRIVVARSQFTRLLSK